MNWWGLTAYLFFIGAFCFYIWARAAHTLGLGPMLWWVVGWACVSEGVAGGQERACGPRVKLAAICC